MTLVTAVNTHALSFYKTEKRKPPCKFTRSRTKRNLYFTFHTNYWHDESLFYICDKYQF